MPQPQPQRDETTRLPWGLLALFGSCALVVIAVSAVIATWKLTPRTRPGIVVTPSPIRSLTFVTRDGGKVIELSGQQFQVLGEQLFPGCREAVRATGVSFEPQPMSPPTWDVTLTLADGEQLTFVARDLPAGDTWSVGDATRPVDGDINLLLAARDGLSLFDRRYERDWERTEELAAALTDDDIDALLAMVKAANDVQRGMALLALNQALIPNLRREQRMALFIDPRNTPAETSASDHPRAAELRTAALAAFDDWNQGALGTNGSWLRTASFQTLSYLPDQTVADHLAAALRARAAANHETDQIASVLEACYALPALREGFFYCPTGESQENIARANAEAQQRRTERRQLILDWHAQHRDLPRAEQLRAALAPWRTKVAERARTYTTLDPRTESQMFGTLIREGAAIVPLLRELQRQESDFSQQIVYEVIIALASGKHDAQFVSRLGSRPGEAEIARKIREIREISVPNGEPAE